MTPYQRFLPKVNVILFDISFVMVSVVDDSVLQFEHHVRNLPLANACLRIDELKIAQVIRNLVSHAVNMTICLDFRELINFYYRR